MKYKPPYTEADVDPLVSISVITYNHEEYIRQCLDSILMQEVNFSYEILIHDDASPDSTANIIREYERKHPDIIKPIYQTENQYSQGKRVSKYNHDRAVGKYLAFCEGDDFWNDPHKLQKQIDFLEVHPEYIATAHRADVINEYGTSLHIPHISDVIESIYTIDEYISKYHLPGHISSIVTRNVFSSMDDNTLELFYSVRSTGDSTLSLLLVLTGDIYCFSDCMSTYRHIVSQGTSWSAMRRGRNNAYRDYESNKSLRNFAKRAFGKELPESILHRPFESAILWAIKRPNKVNLEIMIHIARDYPNILSAIRHCIGRVPRAISHLLKTS